MFSLTSFGFYRNHVPSPASNVCGLLRSPLLLIEVVYLTSFMCPMVVVGLGEASPCALTVVTTSSGLTRVCWCPRSCLANHCSRSYPYAWPGLYPGHATLDRKHWALRVSPLLWVFRLGYGSQQLGRPPMPSNLSGKSSIWSGRLGTCSFFPDWATVSPPHS